MMKRLFIAAAALFFILALSVVFVLPKSAAQKAPMHGAPTTTAPLPVSLDDLYPPKAEEPFLLAAMNRLNMALAGIVVDVSENDPKGASANFENFKTQYGATAKLVPEWESWYPAGPVEELGKVLSSGPPETVMAAVGKVGGVCHNCHLATMVPVQMKYRWPDFGAITIHDPVANADVDYSAFMQMLNASLVGVGTDLGQGQPENARARLADLRSRMVTLRESCDACHDTERAYYVDDRTVSLLADIAQALGGATPDPTAVAMKSRRFGEEACSKCHLVHLPAAYSGLARR